MTAEDIPYGPHKIAQNGQVVIPKDVLKQANLGPGSTVFLTVRKGIVELVPASTVASWLQSGRTTQDGPNG
jgi:AbrB family looped-hinge helix DNA binding protein